MERELLEVIKLSKELLKNEDNTEYKTILRDIIKVSYERLEKIVYG
jgi:2-oxo-4-hydroxy-4-carboxy--5-ureidoimidazoline (OHCU) decarboxylase